MAKEIERKFLVKSLDFLKKTRGILYIQSYPCTRPGPKVRVRIAGKRGFLTLKGKSIGRMRDEYEYEIPLIDAQEMLEEFCMKPAIKKVRYLKKFKGFTWEIDVFQGQNSGLVVAEIELDDENSKFTRPKWLGKEITNDKRYSNSKLINNPYKNWKK